MTEEESFNYLNEEFSKALEECIKYDDTSLSLLKDAAMALFPEVKYDISLDHDTGVLTIKPYIEVIEFSLILDGPISHDTP